MKGAQLGPPAASNCQARCHGIRAPKRLTETQLVSTLKSDFITTKKQNGLFLIKQIEDK